MNTSLAIQYESEYSNWRERALPYLDPISGKPNYLDENGELVEGIFLGMPNNIYHSLPAESSSKIKDFVKSPALYYRNYLSGIDRKRTTAQTNTFDAGTHGHELILELKGYYEKYFRDCVPSDYPDAIHTAKDIEVYLEKFSLKKSGTKIEKALRLQAFIDSVDERFNPDVASEREIIDTAKSLVIFDIERQRQLDAQGIPEPGEWEGKPVTTYGGKVPVDPVVWDDAHRVMKTTRDHAEANAYFQFGEPEVAMFARCPLTGMMLKVKFDWLRFDDVAVDMKTTLSVKPQKFLRQIEDLRYCIQQEFYKYVSHLLDIPVDEFVFVATEYVNMDACQPYRLSKPRSDKARNDVMRALPQLKECLENNHWYGYTKQDCTILLQ